MTGSLSLELAGSLRTGVAGSLRLEVAGSLSLEVAGSLRTEVAGSLRMEVADFLSSVMTGLFDIGDDDKELVFSILPRWELLVINNIMID